MEWWSEHLRNVDSEDTKRYFPLGYILIGRRDTGNPRKRCEAEAMTAI
jgi:hypothetical protein